MLASLYAITSMYKNNEINYVVLIKNDLGRDYMSRAGPVSRAGLLRCGLARLSDM